MNFLKKIVVCFLICIVGFIYIYFFTYNLYNSLKVKTFNNSYDVSTIEKYGNIVNSNEFKSLSDDIYSNAVKTKLYGYNRYRSHHILNLIDQSLDNSVYNLEESYSKQEIRSDLFIYFTSMYQDITSGNSQINFTIINDIFSYSTLKTVTIILCGLLFVLLLMTKSFLWIKKNAIVLLITSTSFMGSWYIIEMILSVGKNLLIPKILLSLLPSVYEINFSYCVVFFVLGIVSIIVYIIFSILFKVKKHTM